MPADPAHGSRTFSRCAEIGGLSASVPVYEGSLPAAAASRPAVTASLPVDSASVIAVDAGVRPYGASACANDGAGPALDDCDC